MMGSEVLGQDTKKAKRNNILYDCFFLVGVFFLSVLPYFWKIGFYSDDWSFLGNFVASPDQSFSGLLQVATTPNTQMRPLQNIYDVLLYMTFHLNPIGYQIANVCILSAISILFYFVLKQLTLPRFLAVSIPVLYIFLPMYSTDRFWYASFQISLSLLFYFLSLRFGLQSFINNKNQARNQLISIGSMILSILSYEITLPMFLLNLFLFWHVRGPENKNEQSKSSKVIFILLNLITLLTTIIFKLLTTIRLDNHITFDYFSYLINLLVSMFSTNYVYWLEHFIAILQKSVAISANPFTIETGSIIFIAIFFYISYIATKSRISLPDSIWFSKLFFFSFVIFILGYAIFITNTNVGFSLIGMENRVAIGAAIGIAISFVSFIGILSNIFRSDKIAKVFFSFTIASICTAYYFTNITIATFWDEAFQQQKIVLSDMIYRVPNLPNNSSILLDGICPYVGPASVFESQWDLLGALQISFPKANLRADIITPTMLIKKEGITTQIYNFTAIYPYKNLYVYNQKYQLMYPLPNKEVADFYFKMFNPTYNNSCPAGYAGNGVNVF